MHDRLKRGEVWCYGSSAAQFLASLPGIDSALVVSRVLDFELSDSLFQAVIKRRFWAVTRQEPTTAFSPTLIVVSSSAVKGFVTALSRSELSLRNTLTVILLGDRRSDEPYAVSSAWTRARQMLADEAFTEHPLSLPSSLMGDPIWGRDISQSSKCRAFRNTVDRGKISPRVHHEPRDTDSPRRTC